MLVAAFSIILTIIFFAAAGIHFWWVLGGTYGFKSSIPAHENGDMVFIPKKIESAIVGVGLSAMGFFYILKSHLLDINTPHWLLTYGGLIIPSIFILRAMGEFKYVGFFKKIRSTQFGQADTRFFSPLCLVMGILGYTILALP
jgi:hypothetical protein